MNWLTMPTGITEPLLRQYLIEARGDIFIAASLAGLTPNQLRRAIRASETLQADFLAMERIKVNPEYDRLSSEAFEAHLAELTRDYRLDGLEAIHEIATMQADSAALYEVKLKAAIQLRGAVGVGQQGESSVILSELNDLYRQNAPRIKSIRTQTVQIEFQDEGTQEREIEFLEPVQTPRIASDDAG